MIINKMIKNEPRCSNEEKTSPYKDPYKFIFDLAELKMIREDAPDHCGFYAERKFINFGYRSHPRMSLRMCESSLLM